MVQKTWSLRKPGNALPQDDGLKPDDPEEFHAFIKELTRVDHPAEEILLKSPKTWTHDEMIQVKKHHSVLPANDPRGKDMDRRIGAWFSHVYSDEPVKHDAMGRMIDPKPVNPPPSKPLALRNADGHDLKAGLRRIGARILAAAKDSGMGDAVKSLQGGLNKLERWRQAESNSKRETSSPPLKEDGVLGPKTKTALKKILAKHGTAQAENAQALGGFHNYAEAGRKGGFKDLAKTVDKSFGSLFRDQAKPKAVKEPRQESLALQDTVNHFGEKQFGRDKWTPLKDDGWIGPKTTDAFAKVAKAVNPERLTRRFSGAILDSFRRHAEKNKNKKRSISL